MQKLFVGLNQVGRASRTLLWREHCDLRTRGQVVGERHEFVDKHWCERLHSVNRNSLGNLLHHRADVRKLEHHLSRLVSNARRDDDFARRIYFDAGNFRGLVVVQNASLICHRKLTDVFELIAKELDAHRVLGRGRKDVDDATAHRKLATFFYQISSHISQISQMFN